MPLYDTKANETINKNIGLLYIVIINAWPLLQYNYFLTLARFFSKNTRTLSCCVAESHPIGI